MAIKKLVKKGDTIFYLLQLEGNEIDLFKGTFDTKRKPVELPRMLKAFPPEIISDMKPEATTVYVISFINPQNKIPVIEI